MNPEGLEHTYLDRINPEGGVSLFAPTETEYQLPNTGPFIYKLDNPRLATRIYITDSGILIEDDQGNTREATTDEIERLSTLRIVSETCPPNLFSSNFDEYFSGKIVDKFTPWGIVNDTKQEDIETPISNSTELLAIYAPQIGLALPNRASAPTRGNVHHILGLQAIHLLHKTYLEKHLQELALQW